MSPKLLVYTMHYCVQCVLLCVPLISSCMSPVLRMKAQAMLLYSPSAAATG